MADTDGGGAVAVASRPPRTGLAVVLLVVVTAGWGSTFLLVKDVIAEMPAMRFLALRFCLAALALIALRPRALLRIPFALLAKGVVLGTCLAGGYVLQTLGLEHTSAAVSGFITGLSVVFTPLLAWPILGHRFSPTTIAAVVVATGGLAVMSLRGASFGTGEVLTLCCAIFYALQIVGLGAWARTGDLYFLTVVQLVTVAAICTVAAAPSGLALPPGALAWFGVTATAILATAVAFAVQSWAQSLISPTRAAIVFTLEPAFAALVAYLGGEALGWSVLVGGVLVVVAMFLTEVQPQSARRRKIAESLTPRSGPTLD
jgi:drug/metabolite transporter (DMT)-like permease